MTVLGTQLHTLADLTARLDPDGKVAVIVLSPLLLPAAVIAFAGGAVVADTAVATVLGIPPSSQKPTPQE